MGLILLTISRIVYSSMFYVQYVCLYIICSKYKYIRYQAIIGTVSHSCSQMDKFGLVNTKQINAMETYKKLKS